VRSSAAPDADEAEAATKNVSDCADDLDIVLARRGGDDRRHVSLNED